MALPIQTRSRWQDRFRQPHESELLAAIAKPLVPFFEHAREKLLELHQVRECVTWHGVWHWTFEYAAVPPNVQCFHDSSSDLPVETGTAGLSNAQPGRELTDATGYLSSNSARLEGHSKWNLKWHSKWHMVVAYLIPDPVKPRVCLAMPDAALASLDVRKLAKSVREVVSNAPSVDGVRWSNWEITSKAQIDEVFVLVEFCRLPAVSSGKARRQAGKTAENKVGPTIWRSPDRQEITRFKAQPKAQPKDQPNESKTTGLRTAATEVPSTRCAKGSLQLSATSTKSAPIEATRKLAQRSKAVSRRKSAPDLKSKAGQKAGQNKGQKAGLKSSISSASKASATKARKPSAGK